MLYKPVAIKDRVYVDGGLVSTTNIDIAVDAGAKFVVVVNPLVPYVGDMAESGSSSRRVSKMGFPQIGYQAFKLLGPSAPARARPRLGGPLSRASTSS